MWMGRSWAWICTWLDIVWAGYGLSSAWSDMCLVAAELDLGYSENGQHLGLLCHGISGAWALHGVVLSWEELEAVWAGHSPVYALLRLCMGSTGHILFTGTGLA
jgi:hypothetical protein